METIEYRGYTIIIDRDEDPESPRELENLGHIVYKEGCKYVLGDEGVDPSVWEPPSGAVGMPVYAYVHNGITINTTGFSCPWDSGQCGYIYMDREKVDDEFDGDEERAKDALRAEIAEFDQYLSGEVYCYTIKDKDGNVVDSLSGCYGYEYTVQEAKEAIDLYVD